jgi:hypothetical protein
MSMAKQRLKSSYVASHAGFSVGPSVVDCDGDDDDGLEVGGTDGPVVGGDEGPYIIGSVVSLT